jgi:hypothetical protein
MSTGLGAALLDLNDRLQEHRGSSEAEKSLMPGTGRFNAQDKTLQCSPIIVPPGGSRQASSARRQVRQGGVLPQERAPNYRVVAALLTALVLLCTVGTTDCRNIAEAPLK